MATAPKTADKVTDAPQTMQWEGMTVVPMQGKSIADKSTLIDVPFIVTGIKCTATKETPESPAIPYVIVEVKKSRNSDPIYFQDSSTGVKMRCEELLQQLHNWQGEQDTWYDVNPPMFCPAGLEVSEYDKPLPGGKTVKGKTYYFTNIGGRP